MRKIKEKDNSAKEPEKLSELIKLENLLPSDFEFEKLDFDNFAAIKTKLPIELQEFISELKSADNEIENYYSLAENLTMLKKIAGYLMFQLEKTTKHRKLPLKEQIEREKFFDKIFRGSRHKMFDGRYSELYEDFAFITLKALDTPYFYSVPTFTTDYKLKFRSIYLMSLLTGIDVRRLKLCAFCSHVFWANPLNKKWCKKKCSDADFQNRRRADSDINRKINEQRRENYKIKNPNSKKAKAEKAELEKKLIRQQFISQDFSKK